MSYSHQDEKLKQELEGHLALLSHRGKIQTWRDLDVESVTDWKNNVKKGWDDADIILLLVSPSFISSSFCYSKKMIEAIERHQEGKARVIPIILKPADWKGTPFDKLQVLPKDGKPVIEWTSLDAAFVDVVQGIGQAIYTLSSPDNNDTVGWGISHNTDSLAPSIKNSQAVYPSRARSQLFQDLLNLPSPQFEQLLFILNPPSGNIPSASASQSSRIAALFNWAESRIGPGIEEIDHALANISGYAR